MLSKRDFLRRSATLSLGVAAPFALAAGPPPSAGDLHQSCARCLSA